jgi:hypothetical protein
LQVTPEHQNFIAPVGDSSYRNSSIGKLFHRLEEKGDVICEMMFQMRPYDEAVAKEFSKPLIFAKTLKKNGTTMCCRRCSRAVSISSR